MGKIVEIKGWVARDGNQSIYFYSVKPFKLSYSWANGNESGEVVKLHDNTFPEVQWSDPKPWEATITITLK